MKAAAAWSLGQASPHSRSCSPSCSAPGRPALGPLAAGNGETVIAARHESCCLKSNALAFAESAPGTQGLSTGCMALQGSTALSRDCTTCAACALTPEDF